MPDRNASTREKRAGPTRPSPRPPKEQRAHIDTREEKDSITAASTSASTTQGQTHDMGMSDDESVDLSAQDHGSPAESVKSGGDDAIKPESEGGTTQGDSEAAAPSMPVQKRRRVTRACDECRRKKIKCDGKQPCTHCSVYSYECTYDKPSNRRRNPAPQYIEALEARLQRAETLLRKFIPDVDLTDPDLDPTVQQEFRTRQQARAKTARLKAEEELSTGAATSSTNQDQQYHQHAGSEDPQIMSMIETIGQLELNDGGEWDFHGISSGAVFLRRMKEHFSGILGNDYRIPFLPRPSKSAGMFTLDSPRSSAAGSPWDASGASSSVSTPNIYDLPPQEKVRALCYYALNCATCLLRLVHIPTFYETLSRLYEKPQESWGHEEHRFLGLLYSVMALGCMYNVSEDDPSGPPISYKSALEEGTKYYTSARMILQDVAECRDMTSLQGLLFMILFLQATSNMSGCYAFLGIALRSSLRMGLHRHLSHAKINPIEDETRRRVFHCVRQMDTYVSAILGFPLLLRDEDIDQPLPTEVDDEYITKDAILMPPPGNPSFLTGTNAHNKLMDILAKVIKHIYPLKGVEQCVVNQTGFGDSGDANATYMISYARIKEIERDLAEWYEQLPIYWRPSPEGPMEVIRVRTLLRFGYAHVQMMLYRPFLHYVSPRLTAGKTIDDRYYNCAAAGISVSRNIIHIAIEIQKQAVLIGPYWFIIYAEFFAILSLVFYVLENPDKAGTAEILADAQAGKEVIAKLAQRSLSADRITSALNVVFDQIPERLKKLAARPATSRKRPAAAAVIPGTTTKAVTMGSVPLQAGAHSAVRDPTIGTGGRRSEELIRPHHFQPGGGGRRGEVKRPPQRTTSFDTVNVAMQNGLPGQQGGNYATNLQDLLPLDMTMRGAPTAAESDASSAAGSQHPRQAGSYTPQSSVNSLYKLDAMMFPSADPFAYPSQPLLESQGGVVRGNSHLPGATAGTAGSQTPEAAATMQFYMPNLYDDIEGQLLGPIPPYLVSQAGPHHPQGHMQHPGQQHHRTDRVDPASQMYTHPSSHAHLLRLQQQQQGQQGGQGQGQGQQEGDQGQQQRQLMEQILGGDPAFRGDWDVLGGSFH